MTDGANPTRERLIHSDACYTDVGRRSNRRVTMLDDGLGRAWRANKISAEEYSALRSYAAHWTLGGLQSHLCSVDLNRVIAMDPSRRDLMFTAESVTDHRELYHRAKLMLGFRPGFVADQIACHGYSLQETGEALGFKSPFRGRARAAEILSDAGYRLAQLWRSLR